MPSENPSRNRVCAPTSPTRCNVKSGGFFGRLTDDRLNHTCVDMVICGERMEFGKFVRGYFLDLRLPCSTWSTEQLLLVHGVSSHTP